MQIGLLSDTHGYMDDRILHHLKSCNEIWHAGDIGSVSVTDQLIKIAPLKAVYGNIDGTEIRKSFPEYQFSRMDGIGMLMIHIAGKPGVYNPGVQNLIRKFHPQILICGHSHILKVQKDAKFNLLYINPGAAGKHGFHKVRTLIRFKVLKGNLSDLEVVELGPRAGSPQSIH